jgi:hypothetical protein
VPDFVGARPGGRVWASIGSQAAESGWTPVTIDQFRGLSKPQGIACLVVQLYRLSPLARELIAAGRVVPSVAVCLESPLTAPEFYASRGAVAAAFDHVFTFPRSLPRGFAGAGQLHSILWPYHRPEKIECVPWRDRRLLTLINSNRRADLRVPPRRGSDGVMQHARRRLRQLSKRWTVYHALGRLPELYYKRLEAIQYFAANPEFDLYGFDWDKPIPGAETLFRRSVDLAYRGTLPRGGKIAALGNYRFALCFENTAHPGYVTEKLLDCLAAGCIPLYLGAPDIERYVPPGSYIDVRRFRSFDKLSKCLTTMEAETAETIVQAGRNFLLGAAFDPFDQALAARRIMAAVETSFERAWGAS